jgi:hypothetical protein
MAFNTAAGSSISIGTTATLASTDTYVTIGQVTNIPEFGRVYNEVKFSPLSSRGVQKVKGSFDEGSIEIDLARDTSDAGQIAALAALVVDANYNFKVAFNDSVPATSATITVTIASPGVVTDTAHGLPDQTPVKFSTTGALPTGITAGTTYYVKLIDANTYNLSATAGGSAINTTGTQSGTHTRTTVPVSSFVLFKAQIASFTSIVGTIDAVMMRKMKLLMQSGTLAETAHIP